jgi:hypothetical protein
VVVRWYKEWVGGGERVGMSHGLLLKRRREGFYYGYVFVRISNIGLFK